MSADLEKIITEDNDVLPADLQPDLADHEDYIFPDNDRRRSPGYLYLAISCCLLVACIIWRESAFVNTGVILGSFLLGVFGIYSIRAGEKLVFDERLALSKAAEICGFSVGHASAQMTWRGFVSKPMWRILMFSADDPPTTRGFVLIDAISGEVIDSITENNPDNWLD